jgi:hypothetical protein
MQGMKEISRESAKRCSVEIHHQPVESGSGEKEQRDTRWYFV